MKNLNKQLPVVVETSLFDLWQQVSNFAANEGTQIQKTTPHLALRGEIWLQGHHVRNQQAGPYPGQLYQGLDRGHQTYGPFLRLGRAVSKVQQKL